MPEPVVDRPKSPNAVDRLSECPACGRWSTDAERRGGYGRGRAPALCAECQTEHPGQRWCKRCQTFESGKACPVPRMQRARAGQWAPDVRKPCPACGTLSTDFERRGGKYGQGVAPRLCAQCQVDHPSERWCDNCAAFEVTRRCPVKLRERDDRLREAGKYRSAVAVTCKGCGRSGLPGELRPNSMGGVFRLCQTCHDDEQAELVQCPSCSDWWPRGEYFAGVEQRTGRERSTRYTPCPDCRQANDALRWCVAHRAFEQPESFGGWSVRSCREGAVRSRHGEDRESLMVAHGTVEGQCMCCYRPWKHPRVDHDHDCCPGTFSCGSCVRGILCGQCNAIEGVIRKVYGPPFPRLIQEYLDRASAYRAQREVSIPN